MPPITVAKPLSPRAVASYIRRMAKTRARRGSYLFQRPGSQNWYIKLQSPTGRVERSLRTSDRQQAEILALPLIGEHKAALLAARPRWVRSWRLEPGREHVGEDGSRIIATDRDLIYLDHNGAITRTEPNAAEELVNLPRPAILHFGNPPLSISEMRRMGEGPIIDASKIDRPALPKKNGDDAVLETYLTHRNIGGYDRREAETVWALFKSLCDKPLKDATRDDGRSLVQKFKDDDNKSATITKKIGWLRAAVELAIDEGKLKFNPFSNIVPKDDDELERVPLSEADVKACKRKLHKLGESDQLLFRLLATTGMRLSEAFQINGELKEKGVRFCIVGEKT